MGASLTLKQNRSVYRPVFMSVYHKVLLSCGKRMFVLIHPFTLNDFEIVIMPMERGFDGIEFLKDIDFDTNNKNYHFDYFLAN